MDMESLREESIIFVTKKVCIKMLFLFSARCMVADVGLQLLSCINTWKGQV